MPCSRQHWMKPTVIANSCGKNTGISCKWSACPTLILHGDDDQTVPIGASALLSAKIVKGATLKIYPGAPHGICSTHKDLINEDLLEFFKT